MKFSRKAIVYATALVPYVAMAAPPQPWQRLQNASAGSVERSWLAPVGAYGPEPYYGLNGNVSLTQVSRDLDTMQRLGFGAVTVQAGYGMPFAYLSRQDFDFFTQFVAQAKQRKMGVWIVDDAGYPSGFAGGKFTSDAPQLRMQAIAVSERVPLEGGQILQRQVGADVVSAAAVSASGQALVVPVHEGAIAWTAPAGHWTVLLAAHEFRTSPTRSDTNPHRLKDSSQSLEDYLNPAATAQFLRFTHDQYQAAVGGEFGKTVLGFRGDEPDYSISGLPWTPAFFARFRELKGYDVAPWVAMLAETPNRKSSTIAVHLNPQQIRVRADYYDVFSRIFADGFFRPQGDWCAAHHLEYQVHLNHEESELDLAHSEGSFFRDMQPVQVPGIDAIWHQIWTDTISDYPRLAASAAHVAGKPRAFTESFAAYRPTPDVAMARYIVNEQLVRGINLVEMMYFPATSDGPQPPPAYMAQSGFAELLLYTRRMSYVLSMGRPDASVALLMPTHSLWFGDTTADTQFVSTERLLGDRQIDFDVVSEDALGHQLTAGKGRLLTKSGNRYGTVILPAPFVLEQSVVNRLQAFAAGGGHVLFLGQAPQWIARANFKEARESTPGDFGWAAIVTDQLPATPTPPAYPPTQAPEAMAVPPAIAEALQKAVPVSTVLLDTPDSSLRVLHRAWRDAEMYLLFNEGATATQHKITLTGAKGKAELWDAATATVTPLAASPEERGLRLLVSLQPYATSLIVVRRGK